MKKLLLFPVALLVIFFTEQLNAAVTYKLAYNNSTQTYTVSFKSTVAYSGPAARITGSTQFTIVAPDPDGTGAGAFAVTNLTSLTALVWGETQLNSPVENPAKDYLFFAPTNAAGYAVFNVPANTYVDLFTFQTTTSCISPLYLFDNINDPLNANISINADNNFKILGGGNVNLYTGNDSDQVGCTCVTYKLTLDPDGQTYRVSFNSAKAYSGALSRITGSTQFTVVFPDPDGAGSGAIQITNLTSLTALQIGQSQLNSPPQSTTQDYVFFAPQNSPSYALFNIPANTNIDLFTFQIVGGCTGTINLYDNYTDPLNANVSINADNNFKTLGGGNTNLYCYNTTAMVPCSNCALSNVTTTQTNVSCFGGSNGTATATATGGVAPYTYAWPVSAASQTTATAGNLAAGTYVVTVTDALTCTGTASVTITQPATALTASISASTNVLCFGGTTGSATVTPAGGTPGYTYLWPVSAASQTTAIAANLAAGTYVVTVSDTKGCTATASATITQPAAALAASISTKTDVFCFGGTTGSATVAAVGGTPAYTYAWPMSAGSQTTAMATNLAAGIYVVTVSDANACTATATAIRRRWRFPAVRRLTPICGRWQPPARQRRRRLI